MTFGKKDIKMKTFGMALVLSILIWAPYSALSQPYSPGPRYTGEEVFDEVVMSKNSLIVRVGSHGCTGKNSFRIEVKKLDGITARSPHYVLTILRTGIDECKAISDNGIVISWDLEKDLGLKGNFTFSVRNMVYSVYNPSEPDEDETFIGVIKKQFVNTRNAIAPQRLPQDRKEIGK
jgi:hypothetical protein